MENASLFWLISAPHVAFSFNAKMELDKTAKKAVRELGDAINAAVEKSLRVSEAIETLRGLGYEPNLTLKLEIGLQEIGGDFEDFPEEIELDLTDEDLRTLRRMKIRLDSEQWTVNKLLTDNC